MPSHPDRVRRNYWASGLDAIPGFKASSLAVDASIPLQITRGPSCWGFFEDGDMVERLYDAEGKLVEEKRTPFHEWNRI